MGARHLALLQLAARYGQANTDKQLVQLIITTTLSTKSFENNNVLCNFEYIIYVCVYIWKQKLAICSINLLKLFIRQNIHRMLCKCYPAGAQKSCGRGRFRAAVWLFIRAFFSNLTKNKPTCPVKIHAVYGMVWYGVVYGTAL